MKPKKWTHGTIGSVSHATMRNQDLMPKLCEELRYLGHRSKDLTVIEQRLDTALNGQYGEQDAYFTDEESYMDLERLTDMLNEHALPYMYFGSHPGDGSDYGFWLDDMFDDWYDGLKVNDLDEIPDKYTGEVLHVNERGNMTLYTATRGKLTEIWAVV